MEYKEVRSPRSKTTRLKVYSGLFEGRSEDEPLPPAEPKSWVVLVIPASAAKKLEEATAELKASRTRTRATQKEITRLRRATRRILDQIEARLP